MRDESRRPSPEDLALLSEVIRSVARSHPLSREDAEDFMQTAQLKLIGRRRRVFSQFSGRSSLRTYLTVVITRLLLDWRNAQYGKWRPSATARRLGRQAVELERLVQRDGHTREEALSVLASRRAASPVDLEAIDARLPWPVRRKFVPDDALEVSPVGFYDPVEEVDNCRLVERRRRLLMRALTELSPHERRLVKARYRREVSMQVLARELQTEPKKLYRDLDRTLRRLRKALRAAGVTSAALS